MPNVKSLGLPLALAVALSSSPVSAAEAPAEKPTPLEQQVEGLKTEFQDLKTTSANSFQAVKEQLDRIEKTVSGGLQKDVAAVRKDLDNLGKLFELANQLGARTRTDLEELRTQLGKLDTGLTKGTQDVEQIRTQLGKIEADFNRQFAGLNRQVDARLSQIEDNVKTYTDRQDGLRDELAQMRKKVEEGSTRVAASPPVDNASGIIYLHNSWNETVSVVIDDKSPAYRLEPGESRPVLHPPGSFAYEVLGQGRRTAYLAPGKTFEIEIYDRGRGPLRTPSRGQ